MMGSRLAGVLETLSGRQRGLRSGLLTRAAKIALVGGAYYVAARLSLHLALIQKNVTPLWPPTGIAVVAFLLLGPEVWPGVALAAFFVNEPISASWLAAAGTAVGNTLAPLVAAMFLVRVGFRKAIDRLRDGIAIVVAALSSMLISASVGAGVLVLSGAIHASAFLGAWAVWWTGDAMGVLVVAPFLLIALQLRLPARIPWGRLAELTVLLLVIAAVSLAVSRTHLGLMFLVLPLLGWAAWRFQQAGSAPAAMLIAGTVTWAAARRWGVFGGGTLFARMLTLQAFNATVALTSCFFAALVTERMRAQQDLERAAAELEARVRSRTLELSAANEQLTREMAERVEAERRLGQRESQLKGAQRMARFGSWEWVIPENRVTWSDEMYRLHGHRPQAFALTFERAVEQIVPEDLGRIQRNLADAVRKARSHDLPGVEYRIHRTDGAERVLLGKARLTVGPTGEPLRMVGTVQDITEDKQAEREHRISESLQRSLLPDRLPEIPGLEVAARYVPATSDMQVGGDWYDVVLLPSGLVGVAIGDVAGHGLRAAATMGQLRMALRAYAIEERSPARVVGRVRQLVRRLRLPDVATLLYVVFDPDSGVLEFANAGHPPPLLIGPGGHGSYIKDGLAPLLGVTPHAGQDVEATSRLEADSTLLLYTDGLVERRGAPLDQGLARLIEEATALHRDLDELCDHLLSSLLGQDVSDDVALLALRPVPFAGRPLHVRLPAEPEVLAPLRHSARRWLREAGADPQDSYEILVACTEACANAIQPSYGAR